MVLGVADSDWGRNQKASWRRGRSHEWPRSRGKTQKSSGRSGRREERESDVGLTQVLCSQTMKC